MLVGSYCGVLLAMWRKWIKEQWQDDAVVIPADRRMWKKMDKFAIVGCVGSACGAVAYGTCMSGVALVYENSLPDQISKIMYRDRSESLALANVHLAVFFILRPFEFSCHIMIVLLFLDRLVRHASHSYNSQAYELNMEVNYSLRDCVGEYALAKLLGGIRVFLYLCCASVPMLYPQVGHFCTWRNAYQAAQHGSFQPNKGKKMRMGLRIAV